MYRMETGRVLNLADSSALLKLLETFKGSRDERVVFFEENQATQNVSKSSKQLSHNSRYILIRGSYLDMYSTPFINKWFTKLITISI